MSDRIAIFNKGRIEQLGRGEDLYDRPLSMFVADFIGDSNILRGRFVRADDGAWLVRDSIRWRVGAAQAERAAIADGSRAALVVRPERLTIVPPENVGAGLIGVNGVEASVRDALYLGSTRKYEMTLKSGQTVTVRRQVGDGEPEWQPGDRVGLTWAIDDSVLVSDPHG